MNNSGSGLLDVYIRFDNMVLIKCCFEWKLSYLGWSGLNQFVQFSVHVIVLLM
jgi:hypothetical protein